MASTVPTPTPAPGTPPPPPQPAATNPQAMPAPAPAAKAPAAPSAAAVAAPAVHAPKPSVAAERADLEAVAHLKAAHSALKTELAKVIVGQSHVIDELLIAIFTRSHALLMGVPGLAKTLMISSLAQTLQMSFKRIQFTPDLMPSDITGTEVIQADPETGKREFKFIKGPIFANMVLADEINRTPPKTQAAMLEAMQERKVTVGGNDWKLPDPFFVLATQNPVEQEGTYPLPEAQMDRFMFLIYVDYPSAAEERQIMKMGTTSGAVGKPLPVLSGEDIVRLQGLVKKVPVADHCFAFAEKIVRVTRPKTPEALDFCKKFLTWGAGPRASLNLIMAAKARAILNGNFHVSCDDIAAVAPGIFRHRLAPNFAAQAEGITADEITRRILEAIPKDKKLD